MYELLRELLSKWVNEYVSKWISDWVSEQVSKWVLVSKCKKGFYKVWSVRKYACM